MASVINRYLCSMMRYLLISIVWFIASLSVQAQVIDSLFASVPNAYMPLLEYNSRLDMLDLYNCGMEAKVYNDLGGEACLIHKDSVHFVVSTTSSSLFELRILKKDSDTIYSCIRTVNMPEKFSQILFLNDQWHPIKLKEPQEISFEKCWYPSDSLSEDRIENLRLSLQPTCFDMHWEEDMTGTPLLVYQVSTDGLMPEDQKAAALCLRPLKFLYKEGKFIPVE